MSTQPEGRMRPFPPNPCTGRISSPCWTYRFDQVPLGSSVRSTYGPVMLRSSQRTLPVRTLRPAPSCAHPLTRRTTAAPRLHGRAMTPSSSETRTPEREQPGNRLPLSTCSGVAPQVRQDGRRFDDLALSLIHISEPTRLLSIS